MVFLRRRLRPLAGVSVSHSRPRTFSLASPPSQLYEEFFPPSRYSQVGRRLSVWSFLFQMVQRSTPPTHSSAWRKDHPLVSTRSGGAFSARARLNFNFFFWTYSTLVPPVSLQGLLMRFCLSKTAVLPGLPPPDISLGVGFFCLFVRMVRPSKPASLRSRRRFVCKASLRRLPLFEWKS